MKKLLLLADDFTGALDAGVAFAPFCVETRVVQAEKLTEEDFSADVLVVDTESRHIFPDVAYKVVKGLMQQAAAHDFTYFYKKTDSVLRGNIGAELAGALAGSRESHLHFIPAFPRTGRTTVGGIQYVDGIPVSDSVFGNDPFNPVTESDIGCILAQQTTLPVFSCAGNTYLQGGIYIHDAATQQDLERIGSQLATKNELHLLAGCAGMAGVLPEILEFSRKQETALPESPGLVVVCGSINPISLAQCRDAEKNGIKAFHLPFDDRLPQAQELVHQAAEACRHDGAVLLDAGTAQDVASEMRERIVERMGDLTRALMDQLQGCALMVIGGDTLLGVVNSLGASALTPLREMEAGVVLSALSRGRETIYLFSKSGGFGGETIISDLYRMLHVGRNVT